MARHSSFATYTPFLVSLLGAAAAPPNAVPANVLRWEPCPPPPPRPDVAAIAAAAPRGVCAPPLLLLPPPPLLWLRWFAWVFCAEDGVQ